MYNECFLIDLNNNYLKLVLYIGITEQLPKQETYPFAVSG